MESSPQPDRSIYAETPLSQSRSIRLLQIENSRREDKTKGNWNIPISLNMKSFDFDSAELPSYRCLSYVWGKKEHHGIFVNGKRFHVTKNLLGFSRRLRAGSANPDGWVWIDAICINQSDMAERASQVAMMGSIYAGAEMVMAWVGWEWDREGDASDDGTNAMVVADVETGADDAVVFVRMLAERMKTWGGDPWTREFGQYSFDDPGMHKLLDFPHVSYKSWRALASLLDRQWFRRTWIVQEASMAKKLIVIVGQEVLTWDEVVQTCIFLQASGWAVGLMYVIDPTQSRIPYGMQVLMYATLQYVCRLEPVPACVGKVIKLPAEYASSSATAEGNDVSTRLYDLLARIIVCARSFEVTDPRDKIWAPLGMVRKVYLRQPSLYVDLPATSYEIAAESIYKDVTARILECSSDLFILSQKKQRSGAIEGTTGLPSWVPDYSQRITVALTDRPGLEYDALPGKPKICFVDRHNRSISLQGHRMDAIAHFASVPLNDMFNEKNFFPLIDFCMSRMDVYGSERTEALWRVLVGDFDNTSFPASPETAKAFKSNIALHTAITFHGNKIDTALQPVDPKEWDRYAPFDALRALCEGAEPAFPSTTELAETAEYWRTIMTGELDLREARKLSAPAQAFGVAAAYAYPNRSLMVTAERGIVGLAPDCAEEGDEIWFLSGGRVPFVLRKRNEERGYELVGECYVHGFMNGEILDDGVGEVEFEEVVIR